MLLHSSAWLELYPLLYLQWAKYLSNPLILGTFLFPKRYYGKKTFDIGAKKAFSYVHAFMFSIHGFVNPDSDGCLNPRSCGFVNPSCGYFNPSPHEEVKFAIHWVWQSKAFLCFDKGKADLLLVLEMILNDEGSRTIRYYLLSNVY